MATNFTFSGNSLAEPTYLSRGVFTSDSGNPPYGAIAYGQSIEPAGDVDIFAITLVANQRYTFDVNRGVGGSTPVDLRLDLIDSEGNQILTNDNSSGDPFLPIRVNQTGVYYIAVHAADNDYLSGTYRFLNNDRDTGDYSLVVSTSSIPELDFLSNASNSRNYSDVAQRILARGGNDVLNMNGGNDIALGGAGRDVLRGGAGDDELVGGDGSDRLFGGSDADGLIGGSSADVLYGGSGADALLGGTGNDLLISETGNDDLDGQSGSDQLYGGIGNDFLRGGTGVDRLWSGTGADTFHFLSNDSRFDASVSDGIQEDRLLDFSTFDMIDLSDLTSASLRFIGARGFDNSNQVQVLGRASGFQEVRVNLDSDRTPEFAILVDTVGDFTLRSGDFIL